MKKSRNPESFVKHAEYPGGHQAINKFVQENLRYPKLALKNRVEGTVLISYTIGNAGKVTKAEVLNGIGSGCDDEAKRVVSLLKFETQKNRKMRVSSTHKIKIHFKLPKKKPSKKEAPQIVYTYKQNSESSNQQNYNITINF